MANWTTEVRSICETYAGMSVPQGYGNTAKVIAAALPKVFDFEYPLFDPTYKNVLETKILRHYYTREIGCETVGLWKLRLETKLNEIMPYYNQLYKSELYNFNPYYDVDLFKTYTRKGAGDQTGDNVQHTAGTDSTTRTDTSETTENMNATSTNRANLTSNANTSDLTTKQGKNTVEKTGNEKTTLSGGDTVTINKTGSKTEDTTGQDKLTRALTEDKTENERIENDTVISTSTSNNRTSNGNGTTNTVWGGKDVTDTENDTSETATKTGDNETKSFTDTNTDRTTNTINKLLDTPQDNINLLLDGNYLTQAGTSETTEKTTQTVDGQTTETIDETTKTTGNATGITTAKYGRTEDTTTTSKLTQDDTGTGKQTTTGGTTRGLQAHSTAGGTETKDKVGNLTGSSTEDSKSVTDSNRVENKDINSTETANINESVTGHGTADKIEETNATASNLEENTSKTDVNGETLLNRDMYNTVNAKTNYTNLEDYVEHVSGRNGGRSYAMSLLEFRKTFLNIDMMIINDLEELFMQLW